MFYIFNRKSRLHSGIISLACVFLVLSGCVEKMLLPDDPNATGGLSTGDTTFLQVHPVWDSGIGLNTPVDLSISQDGKIFVADPGAASIIVFEQSGVISPGYESLTDLSYDGGSIGPIDVDIDKKMGVFFIDGSNKIYTWNYYRNSVGIDSVAESAVFTINQSGTQVTADYGTTDWYLFLNDTNYSVVEFIWTADSTAKGNYLEPRLFYDGAGDNNHETTRLSAITTVEDKINHLYVADRGNNRIMEIYYAHDNKIRLATGHYVWTYIGFRLRDIQDEGKGAGKVNLPLGLDIDYENNLYYSQEGDYFGVHKIYPNTSEGYLIYKSGFGAYEDEIMELGRFAYPQDVAVDQNQMVYVSNSGAQEIQVFKSDGSFFKKAGIEEYLFDRDLGYPGDSLAVVVDSTEYFYLVEKKGLLINPAGITVDDRGVVYVCDPVQSSIFRFRLSNVLDEDLQPE